MNSFLDAARIIAQKPSTGSSGISSDAIVPEALPGFPQEKSFYQAYRMIVTVHGPDAGPIQARRASE